MVICGEGAWCRGGAEGVVGFCRELLGGAGGRAWMCSGQGGSRADISENKNMF